MAVCRIIEPFVSPVTSNFSQARSGTYTAARIRLCQSRFSFLNSVQRSRPLIPARSGQYKYPRRGDQWPKLTGRKLRFRMRSKGRSGATEWPVISSCASYPADSALPAVDGETNCSLCKGKGRRFRPFPRNQGFNMKPIIDK